MAEVTTTRLICAPHQRVWATMTDPQRMEDWHVLHTGFPDGAPESLDVGSVFKEAIKLIGYPAQVTWTVGQLEPPALLVMSGKGPAGVNLTETYRLSPTSDETGTIVTIDASFTGAAVTLMANKLSKAANTDLTTSLDKLAGLVQ